MLEFLRISDYRLHQLFICKRYTNKFINPPFQNYFIKSENSHKYNTRHVKQNSVTLT